MRLHVTPHFLLGIASDVSLASAPLDTWSALGVNIGLNLADMGAKTDQQWGKGSRALLTHLIYQQTEE